MMKTLYSSTFLTLVLAFLMLLGKNGTPIVANHSGIRPSFLTILEAIGPTVESSVQEKVKVEVFNGVDCDDCKLFGQNTLPELTKKYATSTTVDFHLYLIGDKAKENELYGLRGAHCASSYGHFWDVVSEIYKEKTLSKHAVDLIGQGLGLPLMEFRKCLESDSLDAQIDADNAHAQAKKIQQKPTILVNDTMLLGNQPIENIEYIIRKNISISAIQ